MNRSASPAPADRRWLVVSVIVLIAAVAGLSLYLSGGTHAPATDPTRAVSTEFRGHGDETTDTFEVDRGWRILWETTGRAFQFAITGDRDFGTVIDRDGPGSGVTSPVGAGTFRLEITARGPWSIQIIQG